MRTKLLNIAIMIIVMLVAVCPNASAQRHLYNRLELGSGNVWTFMGMEFASMAINALTHRPTSEATLRFGVPSSEEGNLYTYQGFEDWNSDRFTDDEEYTNQYENDCISFKGKNLTSNIIVGEKVGYLSDRQGFMNYCVYGAAYYNLLQLRAMQSYDEYENVSTQRLQLGGGLMLIFGSIQRSGRVIVDAGLRYNLPLKASGDMIDGSANDVLNKGISSHYMFKYSYANAVAIGATVDVMHYNLFKDESICGNKSKVFEFGINLAIMIQ